MTIQKIVRNCVKHLNIRKKTKTIRTQFSTSQPTNKHAFDKPYNAPLQGQSLGKIKSEIKSEIKNRNKKKTTTYLN